MHLRLAGCDARGKPSLHVTPDFNLYLGNPTTETMSLNGVELFGFNGGAYEQRIVSGKAASKHTRETFNT